MATLMLAACGGASEDSKSTAGSKAPTSSQKAPASSKSSTSKAPVKSMSVSALDIAVENAKTYLVAKGKAQNYAAGEFKWAWGLEHITDIDGGEGFIYGSASPAAADYKEEVAIEADGSYTAKFCVSDITDLAAGLYKVYCGAQGFYGNIAKGSGDISTGRVKDSKYAYNFRTDEQCDEVASLAIDSLPPVSLTEAIVYDDGGVTWVKIGGEATIKEADIATWTPYVNFQQVGGNWTNTRVQGENIKWDFSVEGKAYICANINFFRAGTNYNTHLNLKENKQQDCKMEVNIDQTYTVNGKNYQVYSNTAAASDDQNEFWGNLAFKVTNAAA